MHLVERGIERARLVHAKSSSALRTLAQLLIERFVLFIMSGHDFEHLVESLSLDFAGFERTIFIGGLHLLLKRTEPGVLILHNLVLYRLLHVGDICNAISGHMVLG